jgi:O-antigen ligase
MFLYVVVLVFGASLPFAEQATDINDIKTQNLFKQLLFPPIYLIALFSLRSRFDRILAIIKEERFLAIFLLWSFVTITWSVDPLVSFKRYVQILGAILVILAILELYINDSVSTAPLKPFYSILAIYAPLSLMAILFVPSASGGDGLGWQGLTSQKNMLGQISLISVLLWLACLRNKLFKQRRFLFLLLVLSLVLLVGSKSMTSIMCLGFVVAVGLAVWFFQKVKEIDASGIFFFLIATCLLASGFAVIFMYPDFWDLSVGAIGKDATFTGRTDLWSYIYFETKKHFALGVGFGGFWTLSNPDIVSLYKEFIWLPNQAHNGYLDILNETGIIGLIILLIMIARVIKVSLFVKGMDFFQSIILVTVVLNLFETTMFREISFLGFLFLFSYLAFFYRKVCNAEALRFKPARASNC